ncbi:MAG: DUF975 family protein [Ruminococcaceae bacterium]|jgi:uncharacterized membrane protein|nr:DUF975 family protein [Oscillospiraceae bacterium]
MIERTRLKQEARDILRGAQVSPYGFTLLYMVITFVLSAVDFYITAPATIERILSAYPELEGTLVVPAFLMHAPFSPGISFFIRILSALISLVLAAGLALYHLGIRQGREMSFSTLFEGFSFAGRVILLSLLQYIFIYLWSFLFFIPGIIAAYRYRFALYDLLEVPDLSPLEAIRMSKAQTSGFKLDLFVLDLSFLGWFLLGALTMGLADIWVGPYYEQTNVGYFLAIKRVKGIGWLPEDMLRDGPDSGSDPFGPSL